MGRKSLISRRFFGLVMAACMVVLGAFTSFGQEQDKVLATIGSERITQGDLNELANAVPEQIRELYLTPEGRRQTLDYIVNIYVLAAEAEQQGLDKGRKVERLLTFAKKDLLARLYLEREWTNLPNPSEEEARAYYQKNLARFESVHLRHILVKSEEEAEKVMKSLRKGKKFDELATQKSICPSKVRGGDLDWLPRGRLVKEIEDVAFNMERGQVTGPIKSKFGYHVILLEDKKSTFEDSKDYVIEQLKYLKLANRLKEKMRVHVFEEGRPAPIAETTSGPTR